MIFNTYPIHVSYTTPEWTGDGIPYGSCQTEEGAAYLILSLVQESEPSAHVFLSIDGDTYEVEKRSSRIGGDPIWDMDANENNPVTQAKADKILHLLYRNV